MSKANKPSRTPEEGTNIPKLTQDDILQIMKLIENSSFDYLQLEFGDLKLTLSKGGFAPADSTAQVVDTASSMPRAETQAPGDEVDKDAETAPTKEAGFAVKKGTLPVIAPMVGTFYTTPSPGAPPFVSLGDPVSKDATVGLIEVMKVFNAVTAGVEGTIAEVCVQNGQFVEYGQPLFLVAPDDPKGATA